MEQIGWVAPTLYVYVVIVTYQAVQLTHRALVARLTDVPYFDTTLEINKSCLVVCWIIINSLWPNEILD